MIGQPPLPTAAALEAFYPLCQKGKCASGDTSGHGDGWGLSGYNGTRAVYFGRQAADAAKNRAAYTENVALAAKSKSPVVVGHLRKSSGTPAAIGNTHPFHYRDWVFAHNGTIFNANQVLALQGSSPQGETDSERLGLWVIERVVHAMDPTAELIRAIQTLREKASFSSLTFFLSNGKTLWAYREYGESHFEKGESIELRDAYFTLVWAPVGKSWVVCSEPLAELGNLWKALPQRTLAVFTPAEAAPEILPL